MCKLAAYLNLEKKKLPVFIDNKIAKTMEHLFYINSYGQTDGSGVMLMDKEGKHTLHKRALPSPDFINTKYFKSFKSLIADSFCCAFHTRYSTVGANSDENSHPFKHGSTVLMQNGTIGSGCSHKSLVPNKTSPCSVDSDSVAWAINEQGIDDTLDKYRGAGVFMWMDINNKTFNIVKNEERTLYMGKVKGYNAYIFATEYDAIELASTRAGLDVEEISYLLDDLHHVWNIAGGYSNRNLKVKPYVYTPPVTKTKGGSYYVGKHQQTSVRLIQ